MPKQVKHLPPKLGGNKGSKYDVLLDGNVWMFDEDDYHGPFKPESARSAVYQWARKRGVTITVRTTHDAMWAQVIDR